MSKRRTVDAPEALRLQLLGDFRLWVGSTEIDPERWRLRKSRTLVKLLALAPDHQLHREQVLELLWPDHEPEAAANNLHQALHAARRILEPASTNSPHYLQFRDEVLSLCPDAPLWTDVEAFEAAAAQARQAQDPALYRAALELYTGDLLPEDRYEDWAAQRRESLRQTHLTLLLDLARLLEGRGEYAPAIETLQRVLVADPAHEEAHIGLMRLHALAGHRQQALRQYQALQDALRRELDADPSPDSTRLYQDLLAGQFPPPAASTEKKAAQPAVTALEKPRHNLPVPLTSFIGREREIAEVKRRLSPEGAGEGVRLLTLTCAGGSGKTRLALQAAAEVLSAFSDGVWFVEFAPLSDPALVPQTVVTTLGLIEQAGHPPLIVLTDFLENKQALLLLDNCEHLIQACAQLAETLLRACPMLHMLATSREALGVPGEVIFGVPTLSTPDAHQLPTLEALSHYEAVRLFVERAHAAAPGFTLTRDNAPAVAQVCHHLDGIPLALELAAARVKLLRVEQIASRLDDRFRLLTSGARTALPRHQTLQALIDWSYDLLSERERVLLQRLSVFAGGWTLEAAEAVGADPHVGPGADTLVSPYEVLDLLTHLVNKSLIVAERQQGQETRYRMLETIRQYAREKSWAAGEGEMMRQRHLAYFVELAERAEPNLRAWDMVMWLDRLEAELDNIREAIAWALESDIEAELRLAGALWWFWHIRGHKSERVEWLERALSIEAMERGETPLWPERALLRGKALNVAGFLRLMLGETSKVVEFSEESLALFRGLGPAGKRGIAYALWNLAGVTSDNSQGKALVEESLALFREVGDKFGMAQCIMHLGGFLFIEGDYEQARARGEEDLALRREIGDKDGIANALASLGDVAVRQGDYQQAITRYEASLTGFREVGNKWARAVFALSPLGRVAWVQSDYGYAAKLYEQALALSEEVGDRGTVALTLTRLGGGVALAQGDYGRATKLFEEALALAREVGNKEVMAVAGYYLGRAAWAQGEYGQATKQFEAVLALGREEQNNFSISTALYGLGQVARSRGDYASAHALHAEALALRREINDPWRITFSLDALATLAAVQNQMEPSPLRSEGLRRAARLFGAAAAVYDQIRLTRPPIERAEHDQAVAAARAALGEEAFAAAWEEGKAMTLEQVVEYALEGGSG